MTWPQGTSPHCTAFAAAELDMLTLVVSHALKINTIMRWVSGIAQLADCLTKGGAAKNATLDFMPGGQKWSLVDDTKFTAGRKAELMKKLQEQNTYFVKAIQRLAEQNRWP